MIAMALTLFFALAAPPAAEPAPKAPGPSPAAPWRAPEPGDCDREIGIEPVAVYEVRDPKDPTVNLRRDPNGAVTDALPNGSQVLLLERTKSDPWLLVLAARPAVESTGFLRREWIVKGSRGLRLQSPSTTVFELPLHGLADDGAPIVRTVRTGSSVTVLQEQGAWTRALVREEPTNIKGFIHESRLHLVHTRPRTGACDHDVTP